MRSRLQIISTRLSETQFEAARLAAETEALTISEWLRQVIVTQTSRPDRVLETLVEQFEALRYVLLNIVLHLTTDGLSVNRETLKTICTAADTKKLALAHALLARATDITPKEH
jgi:hypothetical protein